ncbi:MAG: hypothetical protein R3F54_17460 [Alphaproteobacteria bacterium]
MREVINYRRPHQHLQHHPVVSLSFDDRLDDVGREQTIFEILAA